MGKQEINSLYGKVNMIGYADNDSVNVNYLVCMKSGVNIIVKGNNLEIDCNTVMIHDKNGNLIFISTFDYVESVGKV